VLFQNGSGPLPYLVVKLESKLLATKHVMDLAVLAQNRLV
jgi:hypothetical protein